MDSIDFNHMFNPIFINMLQNVFGFNWFEFFFGVKQCGVDIVWAGWDVYLLFKNVPWSKCIWPDRSKIWMFEWLSLHVGFNKTAVVFLLVHCVWLLHGSPCWLKGSESVLFSTRSLSEKSSYFLVVQNAPGLQIDDWNNSRFLEDK